MSLRRASPRLFPFGAAAAACRVLRILSVRCSCRSCILWKFLACLSRRSSLAPVAWATVVESLSPNLVSKSVRSIPVSSSPGILTESVARETI